MKTKKAALALLAVAIFGAGAAVRGLAQPADANPLDSCLDELASRADFQAVGAKVQLGRSQLWEYRGPAQTPSEEEKKIVTQWFAARAQCHSSSRWWFAENVPRLLPVLDAAMRQFSVLTSDLLSGKLTYGDYAGARAALNLRVNNTARRVMEQRDDDEKR